MTADRGWSRRICLVCTLQVKQLSLWEEVRVSECSYDESWRKCVALTLASLQLVLFVLFSRKLTIWPKEYRAMPINKCVKWSPRERLGCDSSKSTHSFQEGAGRGGGEWDVRSTVCRKGKKQPFRTWFPTGGGTAIDMQRVNLMEVVFNFPAVSFELLIVKSLVRW